MYMKQVSRPELEAKAEDRTRCYVVALQLQMNYIYRNLYITVVFAMARCKASNTNVQQ